MTRTTTENAVVLGSLLLVALAACFEWSGGLVYRSAPSEQPLPTDTLQSTGSDDDLMISLAIPLFALVTILALLPARYLDPALKVMAFSAAWLIQLFALTWIEVGSIRLTVTTGHNWPLALWLACLAASGPIVLVLLLVRRSNKSNHRSAAA